MKVTSLLDLFTTELQDLYSAETQIVKALPEMVKAASDEKLQKGFKDHLQQTKGHVERLEKVATLLEVDVAGETCEGMEGLLKEGKEVVKLDADDVLHDLAIIGAARRVEHYEMAGYMSLIALAESLQEYEVIKLLNKTLEEEQTADEKLAKVAEDQEVEE